MEAAVNKRLSARPNLDHLKRQAKTLLTDFKQGDTAAVRAFAEHLPAAGELKANALRVAAWKLADAQSVIARQNGFTSWPALSRHVDALRALEGEWAFTSLEVDGNAVPDDVLKRSRISMDGDRFRTDSPEATYEGIFTIDAEAEPAHIDIAFVAGPEAGNTCHGIFEHDGDELVLCLALAGARPAKFATRAGSGHALERLHRVSKARPANVTGGTPPPPEPATPPELVAEPAAFDVAVTPLIDRLQGEWSAVELVMNGRAMPPDWLAHGTRRMRGNEVEVVFGGQKMVHAKVRIDERAQPIAVDYLGLSGKTKGTLTRGIMEWVDGDVRFLMAPSGAPRPESFDGKLGAGTLSRWRRRG
jgi:uncharacterized protein (TIGR03067 family)